MSQAPISVTAAFRYGSQVALLVNLQLFVTPAWPSSIPCFIQGRFQFAEYGIPRDLSEHLPRLVSRARREGREFTHAILRRGVRRQRARHVFVPLKKLGHAREEGDHTLRIDPGCLQQPQALAIRLAFGRAAVCERTQRP